MLEAVLWGIVASASLLLGYFLALRGLHKRTIGLIMGFGAGALISAIAYELLPESIFSGWQMAASFLIGALAFFVGDYLIDQQGGAERKDIAGAERSAEEAGSGAAIFIGTLFDAVPESIILGMGLAIGDAVNIAFLGALFVSNLPEAVAGTVNLEAAGHSRKGVFWMWAALVAVSGLCAGLGYLLVRWLPEADGRNAQAFAAGAMLTMIADAMMPEAFEHGGKLVGLFTVLGFLVASILAVAQ